MNGAQVVHRDGARVPRTPNVSRDTTRSRNGSLCGAPEQPVPLRSAATVAHHDVVVAERGAVEHGCSRLHQRRVAAVVGVEGPPVVGPSRPGGR